MNTTTTTSPTTPTAPRLTAAVIETLEGRQLKSVSLGGDGVLSLYGTGGNDVIEVGLYYQRPHYGLAAGERVQVNDNGTLHTFLARDVESVRAYLYDGDDHFGIGLELDGGLSRILQSPRAFDLPIQAYGHAGNDTLGGGEATDSFYGGGDDDLIRGAGGEDFLFGENGHDRLEGGDDGDYISGGNGNDLVFGGGGNDRVFGGYDDDTLRGGEGADSLVGDFGRDKLHGDEGANTLDGGENDDWIYGGDDNDRIFGRGGNDHVQSKGGHDFVDAGHGEDTVYAGAGNDTVYGGENNDTISGNEGDDVIHAGGGDDRVLGGTGNDSVNGNSGDDLVWGEADDDTLDGSSGDDVLDGGTGDDLIDGGRDSDRLYGRDGNDTLQGGDGSDVLHGGDDNDALHGGDGSDNLHGGDDHDDLYGGSGSDQLYGDAGHDGLYGGEGRDRLDGGTGSDRYLDRSWITTSGLVWQTKTRHYQDEHLGKTSGDATIPFEAGEADDDLKFSGQSETFSAEAGVFSEEEILLIDSALGVMHRATGNDTLMEKANGHLMIFRRVGEITDSSGAVSTIAAWNGDGVMQYGDGTFNRATDRENWARQTVLHEVAHNWDTEWDKSGWNALSDWQWRLIGRSGYTASSGSGDSWWYETGTQFVRPYAQTNPREDFACSFANWFMNLAGWGYVRSSGTDISLIANKNNFMTNMVNAM